MDRVGARRAIFRRLINFWPPFLGAGIRVTQVGPAFSHVDVEMRLRFRNRNYVGTHFGGSLYAMTDPWFMLILMERLGRDYLVWDKAAAIRFRRPGRGRVRARFEIPDAEIAAIRRAADTGEKFEPVFKVDVRDDAGEVVAEIEKRLWVKRKVRASAP